jgi:carboxyl-terminal processing protease
MFPRAKRHVLFAVAGTIVLCSIGIIAARKPDDIFFLLKKNFTIFSEVFTEINALYVDAVDPQRMIRTGIDAMLETLDPYTVVIDEHQNAEMEIMTRGSYGGIGIEVDHRNGQIIIIAPTEGGAAARKGVRAGDLLMKVDGINVTDLQPDEVERMLVGETGTAVRISIKRGNSEKLIDFTLLRERIEIKNVSYSGHLGTDSTFVYVKLDRFGSGAASEVKQALLNLTGKQTKGIILDLRNNPGGLLHEAVELTDLFVDAGIEVARTKGRIDANNAVYKTRTRAVFPDQTLIVLQNRGSASASEIVAGALQDLDRAIIIGERSFGKGLVQIIRNLSYNLSLKVTTAKYYIPSGRSIQAIDYTHTGRKSSRAVADSTRKAFKTKNGRIVYDGAGIEPDVKHTEPEKSFIQTALLRESRYILFANELLSGKPPLTEVPAADDRLFESFKNYLNREKVMFELESESEIDYLNSVLKKEGLYADAGPVLEQLKKSVEKNRGKVLDQEKQLILSELIAEISAQLKGQKARLAYRIKTDALVQEAISIINDQKRVNQLLSAPSKP